VGSAACAGGSSAQAISTEKAMAAELPDDMHAHRRRLRAALAYAKGLTRREGIEKDMDSQDPFEPRPGESNNDMPPMRLGVYRRRERSDSLGSFAREGLAGGDLLLRGNDDETIPPDRLGIGRISKRADSLGSLAEQRLAGDETLQQSDDAEETMQPGEHREDCFYVPTQSLSMMCSEASETPDSLVQ